MLFEFSDSAESVNDREGLERFLQDIWIRRDFAFAKEYEEDPENDTEDTRQVKQPFLRFDGSRFRTRNFVGFIYYEDQFIEIYPKVFKDSGLLKPRMLEHIFFWFRYCRRLHIPLLDAPLDTLRVNSFPEMLIWKFADHCSTVLSTQPFSQYERVEEQLLMPKGKIHFDAYSRNGLASGNWQRIDCVYEPFLYDNTLNRAIKYVSRLLCGIAKTDETKKLLQENLFLLEEVEDKICTSGELDSIFLNPAFSDYIPIKDWCKRFLDYQLYSSPQNDTWQWSLLLPMEYVFEDFIYGFIKRNFNKDFVKIDAQNSEAFLTEENAFQLRHDIYLERHDKDLLIIDTKYKVRQADARDKKKGVAQTDMYQMLSYGYRRGCKRIILLYPGVDGDLPEDFSFNIATEFSNNPRIEITIGEVPFWGYGSPDNLEKNLKARLAQLLKV